MADDIYLCRTQVDASIMRAALVAIQELAAGFRDWNPMDSRDAGEVYPASSVEDLLDDIRRLADDALTARTTKNGDA